MTTDPTRNVVAKGAHQRNDQAEMAVAGVLLFPDSPKADAVRVLKYAARGSYRPPWPGGL